MGKENGEKVLAVMREVIRVGLVAESMRTFLSDAANRMGQK